MISSSLRTPEIPSDLSVPIGLVTPIDNNIDLYVDYRDINDINDVNVIDTNCISDNLFDKLFERISYKTKSKKQTKKKR